jgi:hypothetical protein
MKADMDVPVARKVAAGWSLLAALAAVGFLVAGLCLWRIAPGLGSRIAPAHPKLIGWSIRCLAVAIIAGAQFLLVAMVVDWAWPRDRLSGVLRRIAAMVAAAATISAVALAAASGAA